MGLAFYLYGFVAAFGGVPGVHGAQYAASDNYDSHVPHCCGAPCRRGDPQVNAPTTLDQTCYPTETSGLRPVPLGSVV